MHDWTRPPDHHFDLHGQSVVEALGNVERYLTSQAGARRGGVVRLITGRGRSGGGAPIRTRVGSLLRRWRDEGRVVRDFVLEPGEGSFLVRLR